MTDKLNQVTLVIDNRAGSIERLILEPWGDEVKSLGREVIELNFLGPEDGSRVLQRPDGNIMVIFAWGGATVQVKRDGKIHATGSAEIPCY